MTISRERDLELQELAARQPVVPMNKKLRELAGKMEDGTANQYERGLFRRMMADKTIRKASLYAPYRIFSDEEHERLEYHLARQAGLALKKERDRAMAERDAASLERDAAEERRSSLLRENLVLWAGGLGGELGDRFSMLDFDQRQIVNLWFRTRASGAKTIWAKVAAEFRRHGKGRKRYSDERCRQLFEAVKKQSPELIMMLEAMLATDPLTKATENPAKLGKGDYRVSSKRKISAKFGKRRSGRKR